MLFVLEIHGESWTNVETEDEARELFPQLPANKLKQLWELVSMHGAKKAHAVHSHLRRNEIVQEEEPDTFEEFEELLKMPLENPKIQVLRLDNPPQSYLELEEEEILCQWPGPGRLFRVVCAPAHRSDTDRAAYKTPTVFVLDSEDPNPLNCTDIFRRVGAMHCYNCPATNGGISSCCHLAFLIILLSAIYLLQETINKGVRLVNIKNPFDFLHPAEIMDYATSVHIPNNVARVSKEKRPNDIIYNLSQFLYHVEEDESFSNEIGSNAQDLSFQSQILDPHLEAETPLSSQEECIGVAHGPITGASTPEGPTPRSRAPTLRTHAPQTRSRAPPPTTRASRIRAPPHIAGAPSHEIVASQHRGVGLQSRVVLPQPQAVSEPARSTTSSASYYGLGLANVERFIARNTVNTPHLTIPPPNLQRGKS
jgi:hypothetical protein